MKRTLLCLLAPLLLLSCARSEPNWRDDLPCSAIADAIAPSLPDSASLIRKQGADATAEKGLPDIPDTLAKDRTVLIQSDSVAIDEVGIYLAGDERSADQIEAILGAYLESMAAARRDWLDQTIPGESQKLDQAQILRRGRYVVYLILSKADRRIATENLEKILAR